MKSIVSVILLLSLFSTSFGQYFGIFLKNGEYYIEQADQLDNSAVALATFENAMNETGWATLYITTNDQYSDDQVMYAAGFLVSQSRD
jgi:hypothetical protein